jgi:cytochrome c-type biogenesis protein CcsB
MNKKLFGYKATSSLLLVFTVAIGIATFIESKSGAEIAKRLVYHSLWFETLMVLMAINLTGSMFFFRSFSMKKISIPLFHLSFLLIMAGAFFTHHFGIEGTMLIREGEKTNKVHLDEIKTIDLPYEVALTDFVLERYPGSHSPSSYSSYVTVSDKQRDKSFDFHIYMNHILKYRGWRFFQTSYDQDEKGTILTASRDTIGTPLTYSGYFLAIVLMLVSLVMPGSFFRGQLQKLKKISIAILLMVIPALGFSIDIDNSKVVTLEHATQFGKLIVQDNKGRMKPMNTLNNEFMLKIYGKEKFQGLTSDQVVLSMAVFPEYWKNMPIIKVREKSVTELVGNNGKMLSFNNLFDERGTYLLGTSVNKAFIKSPSLRNQTDKALIQLDEDANIFHHFLLTEGYSIFPVKGVENNKWHTPTDASKYTTNPEDSLFAANIFTLYLSELSRSETSGEYIQANRYLKAISKYQETVGKPVYPTPSKIKAELFYNRAGIFNTSTNSLSLLGFSLLLIYFFYIISGKPFPNWLLISYQSASFLLLLLLAIGIGLRWYIGGYIPISNSFEVMIFLSWVVLLAGLLLSRKQPIVLALSLILSFAFLLVSAMNNGNPEIGTLVPVLKSYWLSIHVAVITSSYALFALAMMLSFVNLSIYAFLPAHQFEKLKERTQQTGIFIQILLTPGLYLLTIGTILGAIWANESWGRYWGWDPKETWALISIIIYSLVAHLRLIPKMKEEIWFHLATFWAFASIIMTFFGVNYLLTGLHSYGGTGQGYIPVWLIIMLLIFLIFSIYSSIRYFKLKKS